MKFYFRLLFFLLLTPIGCVDANDSFNAELSHFVGNTALASAATIFVDKYWPETEHPAVVGFSVSASEAFLGEVVDYASGGHLSWLDVAVGTVGAATGAFLTDQFYLVPKLEPHHTYGLNMTYRF